MALGLAKHIVTVQDEILEMTLELLDNADQYGKDIPAATGVRTSIACRPLFHLMIRVAGT